MLKELTEALQSSMSYFPFKSAKVGWCSCGLLLLCYFTLRTQTKISLTLSYWHPQICLSDISDISDIIRFQRAGSGSSGIVASSAAKKGMIWWVQRQVFGSSGFPRSYNRIKGNVCFGLTSLAPRLAGQWQSCESKQAYGNSLEFRLGTLASDPMLWKDLSRIATSATQMSPGMLHHRRYSPMLDPTWKYSCDPEMQEIHKNCLKIWVFPVELWASVWLGSPLAYMLTYTARWTVHQRLLGVSLSVLSYLLLTCYIRTRF